jgi:hypothetical protein
LSLSLVIAGHGRSKNGVASLAYAPAIPIPLHRCVLQIEMPGTRPGMTTLRSPTR